MQVAPNATKREACGPTTANFYLHSPQRREDWHDFILFFSFFFFSSPKYFKLFLYKCYTFSIIGPVAGCEHALSTICSWYPVLALNTVLFVIGSDISVLVNPPLKTCLHVARSCLQA